MMSLTINHTWIYPEISFVWDLILLTLWKQLVPEKLGSTWMQKQLSMWQLSEWQAGMLQKSFAAKQLGEWGLS